MASVSSTVSHHHTTEPVHLDPKVALDWAIIKSIDTVFTPKGGFLKFEKNKWIISRQAVPHTQALTYFEALARDVIRHLKTSDTCKNSQGLIISLISRINTVWTRIRTSFHPVKNSEKSEKSQKEQESILFNSKDPKYSWLSNCYQTLVFDPLTQTIFMSVENGYQAEKAMQMGKKDLAQTITESDNPVASMMQIKRVKKKEFHKAQEASPKHVVNHKEPARNSTNDVQKMNHLVNLKFKQNPILQSLLVETGDKELIEHTTNDFWGDNSHGELSKGPGLNVLGKILMDKRAQITESEIIPNNVS